MAPHLGGDIEYVGELGRLDKYDLLKDAVCLLNPIRWAEPFGMVMIEAMAVRSPVVTNNRGSAPEIVDHGDTGFLCDDESSLVASLHKVTTLDRSHCRAARLINGCLVGWQLITTRVLSAFDLRRGGLPGHRSFGSMPEKDFDTREFQRGHRFLKSAPISVI